jgi:hypothetical protein
MKASVLYAPGHGWVATLDGDRIGERQTAHDAWQLLIGYLYYRAGRPEELLVEYPPAGSVQCPRCAPQATPGRLVSTCRHCDGSSHEPGTPHLMPCRRCYGRGHTEMSCPVCLGVGHLTPAQAGELLALIDPSELEQAVEARESPDYSYGRMP